MAMKPISEPPEGTWVQERGVQAVGPNVDSLYTANLTGTYSLGFASVGWIGPNNNTQDNPDYGDDSIIVMTAGVTQYLTDGNGNIDSLQLDLINGSSISQDVVWHFVGVPA